MALRTSADNAEDVAAGFTTFRAPLPEHAAEVTSLIADLYSISSSLSGLDDLYKDPRYHRNFSLIQSDLELVRTSLKYTLEDIVDFFRNLDGGKASPVHYKRTWKTLTQFFWDESQYSLSTRLAKYKAILRDLTELAKDNYSDSPLLPGLRNGMRTLFAAQERRITQRLGRMSLNRNPSSSNSAEPPSPVSDRRGQRKRSYERTRPPHLSPTSPLSPSSGAFSDFPPSVPDAPGSPMTSTTATTATTGTSRSCASNVIKEHWAKHAFRTAGVHSLPAVSNRSSRCYGDPQPGIKQQLKEMGYEELLQLSMEEESDMRVSFYLRERDHRVRILCKVPHRTRSSDYYCLPLNLLEIMRDESLLRLCRRRNKGTELVLWAAFRFTTMEDLVIFHSTFLALRSQDAGHPVSDFVDYELEGEDELYGGKISDDGYSHALRVYEDLDSGAVRLQASVHEGEMNRTPVWTAFITNTIGRRNWIKAIDSRTVVIRDLDPVIFMSADDYNPPQTSQGQHKLKFQSSSDANTFLNAMNELTESFR